MKISFLTVGFFTVLAWALTATSTQADQLGNLIITDGGIEKSLTGKAGDAANGRKLAIQKSKGNCLACHVMPVPEADFHGEVGPDLSDVASRMTVAEMRLRLVDPKQVNSETIMPAFYRSEGLHMVLKKWRGKTMLSAGEIEDIIAYLVTLKTDS